MADTAIAIVDDHPLLMEGVAAVLGRRPGLNVLGTGSSAADILPLATAHQLDAMVVDLNMPGDTFQEIKHLRASFPRTRIVVFTASTNTDHAIRALDAGAGAYVLKGSPAADLAEAIETKGARRNLHYACLRGEGDFCPAEQGAGEAQRGGGAAQRP